jgi:hypothetical protein
VNQLLNAAGHTWQEPPAEEARRSAAAEHGFTRPAWSASPEQQPLE